MGKYLRTLRSKVVALTLLVVVGTQAATVVAVLVAANRDMDRRAQENLLAGMRVVKKLVTNRAELLNKIAEPLAADPAFAAAMARRDANALTSALTNRAVTIAADVAVAIDATGRPVAISGKMLPADADLSALIANAHTAVEINGDYYEMVSAPIGTDGLGWVGLGFVMDDGLAQRIASVTGLEMTLIADTRNNEFLLLGSSLSRDQRDLIINTTREVAQGLDPYSAADKLRTEYFSTRLPYLDNGRIFAVLQKPVTEAMAPFDALTGTLLHAAATALVCALALAFYLSRIVARPIRSLLLAARRMRVGNYSSRTELGSNDEFGELAKAFEAMRLGISEREQKIIYQAQFDSLTGLPNRNQAMELLRNSLQISRKTGNPVAIMVMHLQRFREIQSSLGHEIGDEVLRQVARSLSAALSEAQVLARLEGDQFLIISPRTNRDSGKQLAVKLAETLDSGLSVKSVNVTLDACIGICISPDHGTTPDELLRRAAVAKNDAQNSLIRIRVYQNGREARHVRQLAILGDLRRATQENELKLYLQPKVELADSKVCGAEALLRWDHPELGPVQPQEFIPLAESAGNISMVTDWVLHHVVQLARDWQAKEIDMPIAVNLSRRDLLNKRLPGQIARELEEAGVPASYLILEITEEAVVQDIDRAVFVLEQLREMGISISMDDFGVGYSSLGHLQKLPVDELKIDRSFVTSLPDRRQNAAIVRSIIRLAHNLMLEVVAEGVETTAALRWLREEGCERAQGYYLSKPMPAREFENWLRNWEKLASDNEDKPTTGDTLILRPRLIN